MSYVVNSIVPLVFYGDKCQNLKSLKIIMMSWKEQRKRCHGKSSENGGTAFT